MLTFQEYNTGNTVIVDDSIKGFIQKDGNTMTVKPIVIRAYNFLLKRLIDNDFGRIAVRMKCNGDILFIMPSSDVMPITHISQVDIFHIDGCGQFLTVTKSLVDLAARLCEYETAMAPTQKERVAELKAYWDARIKGHTQEELRIGNEMLSTAKNNDEAVTEEWLRTHAHEWNITPEAAMAAVQLAGDCEIYQDWYLDLTSTRPDNDPCGLPAAPKLD